MKTFSAVIFCLALFSCSNGLPGDGYTFTKHLSINPQGYGGFIDTEALDASWEEVSNCYGVDPFRKGATVTIVEPVRLGKISGKQLIYFLDDPNQPLVYGWSYYESREIYLPPDMAAARHEFAECISVYARASRVHGSGCGMCVDDGFNAVNGFGGAVGYVAINGD